MGKLQAQQKMDRGILVGLFLLMGIGLVQVYSSSFIFAIESRDSGHYFFFKQSLFTLLAVTTLFVTAYFPSKWIERHGYLLWWVAFAGIIATFVPSLVIRAGGAARWIRVPGGLQFEPGELLKVAFCILLATFVSRRSPWMGQLEWPLKVATVLAPLVLLLRQPDFGTFVICLLVGLTVLFVFGLNLKYILAAGFGILPICVYLVMSSPYRKARVLAFLDPWSDPSKKGFQVIQSMLSFHSGGLTGAGLGQGQGKLFFLPEAHTDFTLAVLGEEMGFLGFFIVLSIYGFLVFRGIQIAMQSHCRFQKALSMGLIVTFAYSVFINMGVVLGLLPTKGLTLPFLSYGGSSLLVMSFLFGLILNIQRQMVLPGANQRVSASQRSRYGGQARGKNKKPSRLFQKNKGSSSRSRLFSAHQPKSKWP